MSKVLAALAILVGAADAIFAVAVAFGAHITPDQHTALVAVAGVALTVLGVWFHPSIPVGQRKSSF